MPRAPVSVAPVGLSNALAVFGLNMLDCRKKLAKVVSSVRFPQSCSQQLIVRFLALQFSSQCTKPQFLLWRY